MVENNQNSIHIACAIDDTFSYPLSVMLASCLENHRENKVKIHLFSASLSDKFVNLFFKLVSGYNQEFEFYRLDNAVFEGLNVNERISIAAYYRLLIPEYIDSSVKKYLYLDADLIVNGNLESLFKIELGNKILGAVNDIAAIDMGLHNKHNIPDKYLYFNSGVLLVNKNNWLKKNAGEKVLQYLELNPDLCRFHDQDGLNGALYKERLLLSPKWNQQIGLYYISSKIVSMAYPDGVEEAKTRPGIIHFNGSEKPWNQVSAHPFKKKFKKYSRLLNGFNYYEKIKFRKLVKRYIIYAIFGWIRVNRYYYKKTKSINQR